MSKSISDKLLDHEVPPPAELWNKIAAELDDAASGFRFPRLLQNLAQTPPATVWNAIERKLEEEAYTGTAAGKLFGVSVEPPVTAWEKILSGLDDNPETAAPRRRHFALFWKYAAAAAVIGFMAWGASQLFKPGKNERETAEVKQNIPLLEALSHATAGIENAVDPGEGLVNTGNDDVEALNDAALETSKRSYAKLDIPHARKAAMAAAFRFDDYISPDDLSEHSSSGYEEALSPEESGTGRYIVLMTPDGHFIRMSKKLSNLVCCVSGEEQDKDCRNKVDTWRKQLACSDAAHPGNFMDILSLVSSLQDK